jgi:hypothetical protein
VDQGPYRSTTLELKDSLLLEKDGGFARCAADHRRRVVRVVGALAALAALGSIAEDLAVRATAVLLPTESGAVDREPFGVTPRRTDLAAPAEIEEEQRAEVLVRSRGCCFAVDAKDPLVGPRSSNDRACSGSYPLPLCAPRRID